MFINAKDLKLYKVLINAENGDYEEVYKLRNCNEEAYYIVLEIFNVNKNKIWNCQKYNSWQETLDASNTLFDDRKSNSSFTPYIVVNSNN